MGRNGEVAIQVSAQMDRWIARMSGPGVDVAVAGAVAWRAATDVLFDRTQAAVHVLTGDLKTSGRSSVVAHGPVLRGSVTYGGGAVDYAMTEQMRGGEHAYLTRGWEGTDLVFRAAMPAAWAAVVRSWKG